MHTTPLDREEPQIASAAPRRADRPTAVGGRPLRRRGGRCGSGAARRGGEAQANILEALHFYCVCCILLLMAIGSEVPTKQIALSRQYARYFYGPPRGRNLLDNH